MLCACDTQANTYCVHSSFELQSALSDAGTGGLANDRANTIHIVAGAFATSGSTFAFNTASGFALTLDGGYDTTCSKQDLTPGSSILDGDTMSQVLSIQSNGTVTVQHITIQNGAHDGSAGGGVQIYLSDPAAAVIFDDNVVRNNSSTYATGGLTTFGVGTVHLDNNLFVGNSSPASAALSTSMDSGSTVYITNNTITANTNSSSDSMITALGGGDALIYVSNTISYANNGQGAYDFYLYGSQTTQFVNNDFGSINGAPAPGSSGNVTNIDPMFIGNEDYHLQANSPLLDAGDIAPTGGLPALDLEGHPRTLAGKIDMGAYEHSDDIFTDGFEFAAH